MVGELYFGLRIIVVLAVIFTVVVAVTHVWLPPVGGKFHVPVLSKKLLVTCTLLAAVLA